VTGSNLARLIMRLPLGSAGCQPKRTFSISVCLDDLKMPVRLGLCASRANGLFYFRLLG